MKNFKVTIIIPSFNEEGNILKIYEEIQTHLKEIDHEIIFIDDGSSDTTLERIKELKSRDGNVKYISFSRNFGHQCALKAGLDSATGDCVVSLDADLQHPVELIPQLLEKWQEGYKIVNTVRLRDEQLPLFKNITSTYFYKLINFLSEIKIEEGTADFRLLDKKVVEILKEDICEYNLFYRGLIPWMGFKQTSLAYNPKKRNAGKTKYSIVKMINFAVTGITSFSIKPLRFASILGGFISISSFIYGLYALYIVLFTNRAIQGWASILISVLFIGGIQMLLLGIIGEYIGRIFYDIKRRPHYIVNESSL